MCKIILNTLPNKNKAKIVLTRYRIASMKPTELSVTACPRVFPKRKNTTPNMPPITAENFAIEISH
jgi:hypothetical protein